jgi:glycosyltransferase involved in cell wall biosynthesis
MIRAYEQMVRVDNSIPELVLVGQGELPTPVVHLLRELGLSSRVAIRGQVDAQELPDIYRGASVYLQTSYEEGLGMSVLEAMASGLPVVCTDTVGTRETVVDGVTGWSVPQGPEVQVPQLFAERVVAVLRGGGAGMSAAARRRCEHLFSNDVAFQPFAELYEHLAPPSATRR